MTIQPLIILTCDSCEYAKTTRKAIRKERMAPQADAFGAEILSDVWGPSPTQSLGGRKYYITFTDDHTRYMRINLLRTKDEALGAYKAFAAWAKTQHGAQIKRLRSDRGGEFTGCEFTSFLKEQGTERRLTTHDTPNLTGLPEWGQPVWVHDASGSKLDACMIEGRWVGFGSESTHAHRVYWPGSQSSATSNSRRPPCASPSPRGLRGSSQYQHRRKPAS